MRNDTTRWDVPVPLSLVSDELTIRPAPVSVQHWVSGVDVLSRFQDILISWPEVVTIDHYALALRRDRVLLVGEAALQDGYDTETGLAVTQISDAFDVIDISGPNALECLRKGVELRIDHPSRSVMRRVFGWDVMLYRAGGETCFRLHIPRAATQAFAKHLLG